MNEWLGAIQSNPGSKAKQVKIQLFGLKWNRWWISCTWKLENWVATVAQQRWEMGKLAMQQQFDIFAGKEVEKINCFTTRI